MKLWHFLLYFIIILIPLVVVLGYSIPICKNHNKTTNGIINYDSTMKKFVYKIHLSDPQIVTLLNTKNVTDELTCTIDSERSVIRFSEYGSHRDYRFRIQEYGDFSVLQLEQIALIGMQSAVPYKLNPFMVNKLQAEIIPFSQYSF